MAHIQSVDRAAQILRVVAQDRDGATASEVAAALGLAKPTTHHLLQTLVSTALLERADRRYVLGPAILELTHAFGRQGGVPPSWRRVLHEVAEAMGETTYLVGWDRDELAILGAVEGRGPLRVTQLPSGRYPDAHARAAGKLLLATAAPERAQAYLDAHPPRPCTRNTLVDRDALDRELELIRRRGWAEDREEYLDGVSCLAAPLENVPGVTAVIGVAMPMLTFRARHAELRRMLLSAVHGAPSIPSATREVP